MTLYDTIREQRDKITRLEKKIKELEEENIGLKQINESIKTKVSSKKKTAIVPEEEISTDIQEA